MEAFWNDPPMLAAGLQIQVVNAPVFQILGEWNGARFFGSKVKFSCSVEVQDRLEELRVPVEKEFDVISRNFEVIAEALNLKPVRAPGQFAEASVG